MAKTNPNGANQYKVDPRQALFLSLYLDPKSKTFSNGKQSAISAGYEEYYADVLLAKLPTWLSVKVSQEYIVQKAESNLKEFVEMKPENTGELKVKADITKFALERLNRKDYGKQEESQILTGNVTVNIIDFANFLKLKNGPETTANQRDSQGPELVQRLQGFDPLETDSGPSQADRSV